MELEYWKRNHDWENDDKPYYWVDRKRPAGKNAHTRVWVERDVSGFDQRKWTVRKEQIDDNSRGQHAPTNLSDHAAKEDARKAAVEWMRDH